MIVSRACIPPGNNRFPYRFPGPHLVSSIELYGGTLIQWNNLVLLKISRQILLAGKAQKARNYFIQRTRQTKSKYFKNFPGEHALDPPKFWKPVIFWGRSATALCMIWED